MARMNISIPDQLRERMSPLDRKVNWSEVAQAAFEREVSSRSFTGEDMEQVVERLRASKASFLEQSERAQGKRHGQNWAKTHASFNELRTVANLKFDDAAAGKYGIELDKALGNTEVRYEESFWQDGDPDRIWSIPPDKYVEAFVEGAREVWDEVEDKL